MEPRRADREVVEAEAEPSALQRALAFGRRHRRRFQLALIAIFVTALILTLGPVYPRDVTIAVPVGANHADVTETRVELTQDRTAVASIVHRWPNGAPASFHDTVELSPGDYDVAVTCIDRDGTATRRVSRVTSPADGVVRLVLEDS